MKLAYDRNLLVQPAFFEGDVLKQFFNGTAIIASDAGAAVELNERIFPRMTVRVHHGNIPIAEHNAAGPPHDHIPAHSESQTI
jgi:hypothetical protein